VRLLRFTAAAVAAVAHTTGIATAPRAIGAVAAGLAAYGLALESGARSGMDGQRAAVAHLAHRDVGSLHLRNHDAIDQWLHFAALNGQLGRRPHAHRLQHYLHWRH